MEVLDIKNGKIVLLNGAPRSGKSSIVQAVQDSSKAIWINLGVDVYMQAIPQFFQPGIGLRPGGERPDMEDMIQVLYLALYDSIAAHSRRGINVISDLGHHSWYSKPIPIFSRCAKLVCDLPVLVAGIKCPLEDIFRRRAATWGQSVSDAPIQAPILRWQQAVHDPGIYDMVIDTSITAPEDSARRILARFDDIAPLEAICRLAEQAD